MGYKNNINEKGGIPRNKSITSKKSAKYRNSKHAPKYFQSFKKINEIDKSSIKLPKKYVHDTLNQDVWDGENLKENILNALNDISSDFYEFLKIDAPIEDIWFTGSLANYNWTNFSDIDLHILIDFSKIEDIEYDFLKEYFDSKKNIWNQSHDINIKNFEVELYVQDSKEKHISSGIFSVMNNDWIKKPSIENPDIDRVYLKDKIKVIIDKIEKLDKVKNVEEIQEKSEKLKDKIKKMRQSGLDKKGEFSEENLAFKYLRNNGYIEKLYSKTREAYDKSLSIDENEEVDRTVKYNEDTNIISADEMVNITMSLHTREEDFESGDLIDRIKEYPYYELQKVPLSSLDTEEFLTDEELVDKYVEETKINPDYPPIVFDPINSSIIDGMHRVQALEKLGHDTVRAYIGVSKDEINENTIRRIVRNQINEMFNAKGFHSSMSDWINKWKKKGIYIDDKSYNGGVDLGFEPKGLISEKNQETFLKSSFNKDGNQHLKRISDAIYGMTGDDELASIIFYHSGDGAIYIPIDHDEVSEKDIRNLYKWLKNNGYNANLEREGVQEYIVVNLLKPKFSLNENLNKTGGHELHLEDNIENEHSINLDTLKEFISFCCEQGEINHPTKIFLRGTRDEHLSTTASYNPNNHNIHIYCKGRHIVDIMRSIAHELMHMIQMLEDRLYEDSGEDGSNEENEAHSFSGLMIRKFGKIQPKIYENYKNSKKLI